MSGYLVREHGDLCMYATLFFGVLDPMNGQLSYINAGHEPLFVLNPDGTHTTLKPKGLPVGMQPGEKTFDIQNVRIEAGQILLGKVGMILHDGFEIMIPLMILSSVRVVLKMS